MRRANTRRVFGLLREQGQRTRQQIARDLHLSLPTVNNILGELQKLDLICEVGEAASTGGRKPRLQSVNYGARLALGVEITRNHLRFVLSDLAGVPVRHQRLRVAFVVGEDYFARISALAQDFLRDAQVEPSRLVGIGLAIPGIVRDNRVEFAPTLGARGLSLADLSRHFPLPVLAGNEATLAGFAEIWGRKELSDAVFISLDKGVGGAVLMGNRPYTGTNGRAGEIGHMTIVPQGAPCSCGRRGCLEAYCSTEVLGEDIEDFFARLGEGDAQCRARWEEYLTHLATAVNSLRMVFDAQVILGGDIDKGLREYLPFLHKLLHEKNSLDDAEDYVRISRYAGLAPAMGAALMAVDAFIEEL